MNEFLEQIIAIIKSDKSLRQKRIELEEYHESDIADVVTFLNDDEKELLFKILSDEDLSEVISYVDDNQDLIEQFDEEKIADILEEMDSDDAVDILENLDEDERQSVLDKMDKDAREDAELILSYDEDTIGRLMTTNYIFVHYNDSIKQAMRKLIKQSGDNDNISTIFVVDDDDKYYGAIDLKDLIRARQDIELESIILTNYPSVNALSIVSDVYQDVIEYGENIIPVIDNNGVLIGALTAHDLVEVIDEELSEDYNQLAAINGDDDINSSTFTSMKKRIPWLILLLFLGFGVSLLISSFGNVISSLTTMVFFQSIVLGMAGNSGTQSLAVTVRALSEEKVDKKLISRLIFKELRVGLLNGFILALISFITSLLYFVIFQVEITNGGFIMSDALLASSIIAISLLVSMTLASLIGTLFPIILHAIKIDPAVASGPLITTVNDLIAVTVYYGLSYLLLLNLL